MVVTLMETCSLLKEFVKILKAKAKDYFFKKAHRRKETDFTRTRKLCFSVVIHIMIDFRTKSNELTVYCFLEDVIGEESVTRTAFENARNKVKSSAFKEL